jgi:hypothetical protein
LESKNPNLKKISVQLESKNVERIKSLNSPNKPKLLYGMDGWMSVGGAALLHVGLKVGLICTTSYL